MIFSVTERGSFRRCRRLAILTSRNGEYLTKLVPAIHLNIGTLCHTAHQHWLMKPEASLEDLAMNAAVKMYDKMEADYRKQVGAPMSDVEKEPFYEAVQMARAMCANYQVRWGTPLPSDYVIVRPEQKIAVPIPGTEHTCTWCNGTGQFQAGGCTNCNATGEDRHYLEGRLDGLVQDDKGRLWILEHKTYKSRPNMDSLNTADQFLAYMWLVTRLDLGEVGGILYDGMWKREKPPRGRTFEDLFMRLTLLRSPEELDEFGRFLTLEALHMADLYRHPETAYPNRRWEGCFDCGMEPLCRAMSRGEDIERLKVGKYTRRTDEADDDGDDDSDEADT